MYDRLQSGSAARVIFGVLTWAIITEVAIVCVGLVTERSLPLLLHVALIYLGSYGPLLIAIARQSVLDQSS